MISDRDIYFFDLRGYLLLKGALSADEVAELNTGIDAIPPLEPGQWHGHVRTHTYGTRDGLNLQQIYEAGEPFECLIDHPAWFERATHFIGGEGNFDSYHGPAFIDENFANLRGPGEAIGIHNGGHLGLIRCQYRVLNGRFHCAQINVLMALTDIHEGDVLMFVDAVSHGSAKRVNPGQRRVVVYRYGPSWGNFRHPYQPSAELFERLTPKRRQIVHPQAVMAQKQGVVGPGNRGY